MRMLKIPRDSCSGVKELEPNAVIEKEKEKLEADDFGGDELPRRSRVGRYAVLLVLIFFGGLCLIMVSVKNKLRHARSYLNVRQKLSNMVIFV